MNEQFTHNELKLIYSCIRKQQTQSIEKGDLILYKELGVILDKLQPLAYQETYSWTMKSIIFDTHKWMKD